MSKRQSITIDLTAEQAKRLRRLGQRLWPEEDLNVGEISRRLLLEHLL